MQEKLKWFKVIWYDGYCTHIYMTQAVSEESIQKQFASAYDGYKVMQIEKIVEVYKDGRIKVNN